MSSKQAADLTQESTRKVAKPKKTSRIRKGRKKNPISNFLLITYRMLDVSFIRMQEVKALFDGIKQTNLL